MKLSCHKEPTVKEYTLRRCVRCKSFRRGTLRHNCGACYDCNGLEKEYVTLQAMRVRCKTCIQWMVIPEAEVTIVMEAHGGRCAKCWERSAEKWYRDRDEKINSPTDAPTEI